MPKHVRLAIVCSSLLTSACAVQSLNHLPLSMQHSIVRTTDTISQFSGQFSGRLGREFANHGLQALTKIVAISTPLPNASVLEVTLKQISSISREKVSLPRVVVHAHASLPEQSGVTASLTDAQQLGVSTDLAKRTAAAALAASHTITSSITTSRATMAAADASRAAADAMQ